MFYILSKIGWFFLAPSNVLAALVVLSAALSFTSFAGLARWLAALSALAFVVMGFSPLGHMLILPLEERFPPPPADSPPPDGIIVLGGSFETSVTQARGQIALNEAGERLTAFAQLAHEYPDARLVFTGGSAEVLLEHANEAETAAALFQTLGIVRDRLELEDRARNTWQNAAYTRDLVQPKPGERWWVVTSAWHMPRAVGAFRAAGFPVEAYPVDYRTRGPSDIGRIFETASDGLRRCDVAIREWLGLIAYRITGRTQSIFPMPVEKNG